MKKQVMVGLAGLMAGLSLGVFSASADFEVSAGIQIHAAADFYAPLTPYGSWVEVGTYGRCWHPARVAGDWRPYCNGEWVWTDCGWYWQSDDPWAWACYHYGRWVFDPAYGWVWVPDVEWAPAWVYWRYGGDYVGWAPCPPGGFTLAPSLFVFVDVHRFREPIRPSAVIVNNTTIINRTTLITDFKRETRSVNGVQQRVVINHGPGVDPIQKATGRTISATPIHEAVTRTPLPSNLRSTAPSPSGREAPRVFQEHPAREQTREPREQPKQFQEQRPAAPPPQYERPVPPPPAATPERPPAPPTGRGEKERIYPQRPPPSGPPAGKPVAPPAEKEREHEKDKDHP